ncbi:MAG: fasciclin [Bacteroidaceae bacterium]|nr:fasciclin [Bacteroidaceae bacterium]
MKNWKNLLRLMGVAVFCAALPSCIEDISNDPHYAIPETLKGSAYETLQEKGNYTIFLKGIDLVGYQSIVDGMSSLTVMAPDDEAFASYLKGRGYSSIEEMYAKEPNEVKKLIGFHLVYYGYNWDKFVNFRPNEGDEATEEERMNMAGYYYKFQTRSSDGMTREYDPAQKDSVDVWHLERFIPVFSSKMFETKGIDAKYNYEYFFPETKWTGNYTPENKQGGFNIANASVLNEGDVITDNGYLYYVDKVIRPMETIYTELKNNKDYSTFFQLYDGYSRFEKDVTLTTNFGKGKDLYLHGSTLLPIAYEWPNSSYRAVDVNSREGFNIFAPSNAAIRNFFTNYWTPSSGYTSFEDLDQLIVSYFIQQTFGKELFIAFPEEIKKGNVLTTFGTPINIDPDKVTWRQICCNGVLYGMDDMNAPAIFSSVIGSAFRDRRFLPYLYALDGSDLVLSLASPNASFVALIPDTAQFKGSLMKLENITGGRELQVWSEEAGAYTSIGSNALQNLVNMHISTSADVLKKEGLQVVETNVAFNYWYIVDGKITTSSLFNQQLNPTWNSEIYFDFSPLEFDEKSPNGGLWDNGRAYVYTSPKLFETSTGDPLRRVLAVCNDKSYPYYLFSQLLVKAGLVSDQQLTIAMSDARFIAFVPSNEAIKKGIEDIPGCSSFSVDDDYTLSGTISSANKTKLANYLRSYFITSDLSPFSVYPYPGSGLKGTFDTSGTNKLVLEDDGVSLAVHFADSENAPATLYQTEKYHSLPFAYSDGCFLLINDILK